MSLRDSSPERAQTRSRLGDALLLGIASSAAAIEGGVFHWKIAIGVLLAATTLWLITSRALGQYSATNGRGFLGDIALTLVMVTAIVTPIAVLLLVFPQYGAALHPGRALVAVLPTVLLLRVSLVGARLWRKRRGTEVLIAGVGPLGRLTGAEIGEGQSRQRLLGYLRFDDEKVSDRLRAPVLGAMGDLEGTLRRMAVDEVYFASTANEHRAVIQEAIRTCETLGVPFALPTCPYRLTRARLVGAHSDGYAHFLSVQVKPIQWFMKRFFDIVASASALAVLSPLLIGAAILVKLTSRGPILFKQERVGYHGR
ncbi:MAG TPA: sugar transferase, partial [Polyangiaceae bacterium]|nr:sugar transferase [Polyangiaceae bacterium]